MRLTIALLLLFTFQVNANSYAQKITIVKKNARLTELFKSIEEQTGFLFFYDKVLIRSAAPIDVDIRDVTLEQALSACLKNQQLTYSIVKTTIVIRPERKQPKQLESKTTLPEADAPPIEIRGQVKDEEGNPLANASVTIKGSNRGVTTDANGEFTIEVPDDRTILVISFTSFTSQEIRIGSRKSFNLSLVKANSSLDAVVVTALGIKRQEKSLTYSEQTVKTSQMNEAKETNVINTLQGKIAGITITKNATGPGSSSKVLLRGTRSIFGNSQPLYVVDGVPLDNTSREQGDGGTHGGRDGGDAIGMLNSDDIESLTVLKGASAAALYGSQGQNGAIIITTKRGKVGKVSVSYTGNITMDQANILPEMQSDYGQGAGGVYNSRSETSWGPKISGQPITLWNGHNVNMTGQPDRLTDFFRKALSTSNTVSVTGGSEKMQTYFSYGNTNAQGILRNHDLNRNNFDLKIENNITSKLSFFAKMTYIIEDVNNKPFTGERNDATGSIYHAPASIPLSEMQNYEYFDSLGFRKQSYWSPNSTYFSNPYWKMYRMTFHEQKRRLLGLFSAQYKFNSWLDLQVRGSVDRNDEKTNEKMFQDSYELSGNGNLYNLYNGTRQATNMDALLSINRDLGKDLNLTAHIGGSVQQTTYTTVYTQANGLNKLDFFTMDNAKNPKTSNIYGSTPQVQSLYATATLSFKDYLYLDVTARNDWSSALPKENQSYFYPSFGLSAILSDILKLPSWISYGKARVSIANAGYGGQEYLTNSYFNVAAGGTINPPAIRSLGNYKPEITTSFEAGLNFQFFDNRLGFDATYYSSQTKNQLISLSVPNATLYSAQYINAGLIENKGVEIIMNGTPVKTKAFSWEIGVNFAKNINKLVRLTDALSSALLGDDREVLERADVGRSFGEMYMAEWKKDSLGRKLVDANGVPIVTGKTAYAGNYNPDYMLGVSNTLNFSRLSLRFLIDYRHGGTVVAGTQAGLDAVGDSKQSLEGREGMVLDAFTADGKINTKSIKAETYWQSLGNRTPVKDVYAFSATNMRLRELALGYRISDRLTSKTNVLTAAKLSLVARNLFFFQRDAPYDPEIATAISNRGGLEYNSLPSTRSIGLNLTMTF
ncbi:MAG: SusC/RagA family TonB-linked outer membrane protein [Chitinophagaceae bacterium]